MNEEEQNILNSNLPDATKVSLLRRLHDGANKAMEAAQLAAALRCAMVKLGTDHLTVPVIDFVPAESSMKISQVDIVNITFTLPNPEVAQTEA